jgi:hypothetical protein
MKYQLNRCVQVRAMKLVTHVVTTKHVSDVSFSYLVSAWFGSRSLLTCDPLIGETCNVSLDTRSVAPDREILYCLQHYVRPPLP